MPPKATQERPKVLGHLAVKLSPLEEWRRVMNHMVAAYRAEEKSHGAFDARTGGQVNEEQWKHCCAQRTTIEHELDQLSRVMSAEDVAASRTRLQQTLRVRRSEFNNAAIWAEGAERLLIDMDAEATKSAATNQVAEEQQQQQQ